MHLVKNLRNFIILHAQTNIENLIKRELILSTQWEFLQKAVSVFYLLPYIRPPLM